MYARLPLVKFLLNFCEEKKIFVQSFKLLSDTTIFKCNATNAKVCTLFCFFFFFGDTSMYLFVWQKFCLVKQLITYKIFQFVIQFQSQKTQKTKKKKKVIYFFSPLPVGILCLDIYMLCLYKCLAAATIQDPLISKEFLVLEHPYLLIKNLCLF